MKPVILVTGKNGQLGNELQQLAASFPFFMFIFTDRTSLDITDETAVNLFFQMKKIDYCINAAAYTAVDKAESEKEAALLVNQQAVANLSNACAHFGARLLHVSTDYVFDGTASEPYSEDHPVSPVNFYGETKLKGEMAALKYPLNVVVRTSWVYSKFGNNFVKTMLRLMGEKDSLNVVSDQVGSPTYAYDLAKALLSMIEVFVKDPTKAGGVYHYSNEGVISWYDFAVAIKEIAGKECNVSAIPTTAYPTPARRPAYSVLDKSKIIADFSLQIPAWRESLMQFFQ